MNQQSDRPEQPETAQTGNDGLNGPDTRDYSQKQPGGEIYREKPETPFLKWLDNFWYHYKWTVIIATFFAILAVILIVQIVSKTEYDMNLVIAYNDAPVPSDLEAMNALLERTLPEDMSGDGEKHISISTYSIFSEDDYYAAMAEAQSHTEKLYLDRQYNTNQYNNFHSYVLSGECSICIVSPYLYGILAEGNRLLPVSDVTSGPLSADSLTPDGYGVYIGSLDYYRYNEAMQIIPDDVIICICRPTVAGQTSHRDYYDGCCQMFRCIIEYSIEE